MQALIEALVEGPNAAEVDQRLHSALPSDIEVLSVELDDGVVDIDLSEQVLDTPPADLQLAVAQIVLTATELRGDRSVIIRVERHRRVVAQRRRARPVDAAHDLRLPRLRPVVAAAVPDATAAGRDDHHDGADDHHRRRS